MAIDENEFQAHVSKGFMDTIGALQKLQPVLDRHENAIKDIMKALEGVTRAFDAMHEMAVEHHDAINDLKKRTGGDELPPFDRGRFSIN